MLHLSNSTLEEPAAAMVVGSDALVLPPVLDACCGSRMFWFDPETGNETLLNEPLTAHDAKWGMNGLPGWVFRVRNGQPTAYTLDWKNTVEQDEANIP